MSTKLQVLLPTFIAILIIGLIGISNIPDDIKIDYLDNYIQIKIDSVELNVKLISSELYKNGFMFEDEPLDYNGVLFVFENQKKHKMNSINIKFPIDIIWFNTHGDVVYIAKYVEPCMSFLETITCVDIFPAHAAKFVFETKAGFVDEFNISQNSKLQLLL